MGIIRFLLAYCVVFSHYEINSTYFLYSNFAVQIFYIFSGFYISLILNNNSYKSYKNFILSRYLRLFPIYFLCLITTFIFNKGNTIYHTNLIKDNIDIFSSIFLIFTNITILFQDLIMFLGINKNSIQFVSDYNNSSPRPLFHYLYVPQGWSLGLELSFYLLAPIILSKINLKKILIIVLLSFLLRIILIQNNLSHDPWSYRFFPTELIFFLFGSIGYIFYKKKLFFNKLISIFCVLLISLTIVIFKKINIYTYGYIIFYFVIIFSIPSIFNLTKNNKLDRFLGELSYPIYCLQFIGIGFCIKILNMKGRYDLFTGAVIFFVILILSVISYLFVQKFIDEMRSGLKKNKINSNIKKNVTR
jgi:peptidoglycan/LPS O-acetylase OafA/YrhL